MCDLSIAHDFGILFRFFRQPGVKRGSSIIGELKQEHCALITEDDLLRIYDGQPTGNPKDREGAKKPPLHLIPSAAEITEAVVMGLGAEKYGPFNWRSEKVRASIYIAAARRHLAQWFDGQDHDLESGVSHLAHARASLGILIDAIATDNVIDDRPPAGIAAKLIGSLTRVADEPTRH
jgi:hypothetical protein